MKHVNVSEYYDAITCMPCRVVIYQNRYSSRQPLRYGNSRLRPALRLRGDRGLYHVTGPPHSVCTCAGDGPSLPSPRPGL